MLLNGKKITLPLLERPRPIWSMPRRTDRVPGRKFYLHHQGWKKVVERNKLSGDSKEKIKPNPNNRSVQAADIGAEFRFEIRFNNLRDWELGLLVYVLQLEKKPRLAHKMGMGKALGFGSVDITVDGIVSRGGKLDVASDLKAAGQKLRERWEVSTDTELSEKLGDLFKLLTYIESDKPNVRYPTLQKNDDEAEGLDGYMELQDKDYKPETRREKLTRPWMSWA